MSLSNIMNNRRKALVARWIADPLILVIVEDMHQLRGTVDLLHMSEDGLSGATVKRVGRRSESNVAILKRPGNPDETTSVWVKASYRSYRSAYLAFVKEVYGIDAKKTDFAGFDADHLLNRARSSAGNEFIRLEAVPSDVNQGWGRTFEKSAGFDSRRSRRTMDFTICAKVAGLAPPRNASDTRRIDEIVRFFIRQGMPRWEAEGFRERFAFGYRKP